jgi:hypothetical protein
MELLVGLVLVHPARVGDISCACWRLEMVHHVNVYQGVAVRGCLPSMMFMVMYEVWPWNLRPDACKMQCAYVRPQPGQHLCSRQWQLPSVGGAACRSCWQWVDAQVLCDVLAMGFHSVCILLCDTRVTESMALAAVLERYVVGLCLTLFRHCVWS